MLNINIPLSFPLRADGRSNEMAMTVPRNGSRTGVNNIFPARRPG